MLIADLIGQQDDADPTAGIRVRIRLRELIGECDQLASSLFDRTSLSQPADGDERSPAPVGDLFR